MPQTHLLDLAGPAQVFYEASRLGGSEYGLSYGALSGEIRMEQNILVGGLQTLREISLMAGDFICFPGIDFASFKEGNINREIDAVRDWVLQQKQSGVFIGSICSGALVLGRMGLLNSIYCTSHWKCLDYLKETYPRAKVREDRLYCFDRGIFTSAGMTAGIDMSLALIEEWDSPLIAAHVAREMVINIRRPDTVEQRNVFLNFKNHFNQDVYRAQEILATEMSVELSVSDLAKRLHMSGRHLTRLFKKHTGQTIQDYRDRVRMELGERLLRYSEKSIKEIAVECGYENSRQFLRLWKKYHGDTPSEYRTETAIKQPTYGPISE